MITLNDLLKLTNKDKYFYNITFSVNDEKNNPKKVFVDDDNTTIVLSDIDDEDSNTEEKNTITITDFLNKKITTNTKVLFIKNNPTPIITLGTVTSIEKDFNKLTKVHINEKDTNTPTTIYMTNNNKTNKLMKYNW